MKIIFIIFCTIFLLFNIAYSQGWQYDSDFVFGIGPHGIVVTPDDKIWIGYLYETDSINVGGGNYLYTKPLWIYNPDGTLHHKIQFLTYDGDIDTLINGCRGLALDNNGNVLFSHHNIMRRINYQNYDEMNRLEYPFGTNTITKMACDGNGYIYVHRVVSDGDPLKIFDNGFNYFGTVIDSSFSASRSVEVSSDGKDVYLGQIFGGDMNNGIIHYHSDTGPVGSYSIIDTMHKEIWAGHSLEIDNNGLIWAGSHWDLPNNERKGWYAINPIQNWKIVDSVGQNINQSSATGPKPPPGGTYYAPRGLAWSNNGNIMYTVDFEGLVIKKWIHTAQVPSVITSAATGISSTSATLNGTANANGSNTTVIFEYGLTTSYGNTITAIQSPIIGTVNFEVSADILGLTDNTTYHYRVVATNSIGTTNGNDETFMTLPSGSAPTASTNEATNITDTTATFNGTVNANGLSTDVIFEYGLTPSYGNTITAIQSPITGLTNNAVSADISGLTDNTTYHYRVVATNSQGTTIGNNVNFITLLLPPLLSLPVNFDTGLPPNPTFQWNAVIGADSYHLQVSLDGTFTNLVLDQPGIINITQQISNLEFVTHYYWRVRAENFTGGGIWSDIYQFTTMAAPSLITQNANPVTDVSAQLNALVNTNGLKLGFGFEYGETSSYSHYVQATPDTVSGVIDVPVSAYIGGLFTDRDYHFRVVAQSADGSIFVHGDDQVLHTAMYPTSIDFSSPNIQFPHHNDLSLYVPQDYRIIGIPGGTISKSFADIMQGVHGADWQVYFDNGVNSGNPEDYFVEFDGGSEFHFGDGRAFWIIYKGDLIIQEQAVPTIGLNVNEEAEIYLHPGWNLITNPFDRPIEWWKIQQSNSIGPINHFDGTGNWLNSDDHFTYFEPFLGYYVFTQNGMTLLIPYGATSQSVSSRPVNYTWKMDISLSVEGKNVSSSKIGVSNLAQKDLDELDYRKPRAIGPMPSIYFNRPEWDDKYAIFACDMRPEIQDVEKWEFTVLSSVNHKSKISFSGIEDIPLQYEVYFLDEIYSTFVNLRVKPEYNFIPVTKKSVFSVLVGNHELIQDELENLVPTEFKLGKNFPNPFNPSTIIPVTIPEESELTLKVYNVLGQEIKTIFGGTKNTGKHYFRWDGSNYLNQQVAAGIYLYRMRTDKGHSFVGKMVLVK